MRRLICLILTGVLLLATAFPACAEEGYTGDIDISEFLDDFTEEEISLAMPSESEMTVVAENEKLRLCFDEQGMDLYVFGGSGRVWTNVITEDFFRQEDASPSIFSQLLTVTASDSSGSVREYTLYDGSNRDIAAECEIENGELTLSVKIGAVGISFDVRFGIRENGFYYVIPDNSIKEEDGKLVSISMMHNFGASRSGQEGYLFYPDGCGAIMNFDRENGAAETLQQYAVYGSSDLSFVQLERNWTDRIYGALLPVWGISNQNDGLLAVIEDGAVDARINLSMPGYQVPELYRAYASYIYRTHASTILNDTNYSVLIRERSRADHGCYFELLSKQEIDYSGMAVRYRQYLTDRKILTKRDTVDSASLSLNLLCGVQKDGLFGKTFCQMTSFSQAKKIVDYFTDHGVNSPDVTLSGWSKGGWDAIPTKLRPERRLGGAAGLKKLSDDLQKSNGSLLLDVESILANNDTGKFNLRKDAVRNYFGQFYCDKSKTRYILNAERVLAPMLKKFVRVSHGAGMHLLTVGKLVYPNYNKNGFVSPQSVVQAYEKTMAQAKKKGIEVSVSTGNAYVLSYADRIFNLPQEDSGYAFTSRRVPFYQMVLHGYIPYTGTVGNTHYDYRQCVLEWVENGCVPSYILNWNSTSKLMESDYDEVFSSEFSVWKKRILDTEQKFSEDFSALRGQTIDRHEVLNDGVVRLTYSNGTKVYVNYNDFEINADGRKVGGKDYLIVGE